MPRITKCWYKDCDSDKQGPELLFYKFPKDLDRCEKWVRNCANDQLTIVWNESPDKVAAFRICQKHFLKEFLGSTSRLVGHAVPAPYGVTMDSLETERFMTDCASLKSSSSLVRQPYAIESDTEAMQAYQQEQQYSLPYYDNSALNDQELMVNMYPPTCDVSNSNHHQNYGETIANDNYIQVSDYNQQQITNSGTLMNLDQVNHNSTSDLNQNTDYQLMASYVPTSNDAMTTVNEMPSNGNQYATNYQQDSHHMPVSGADEMLVYQQNEPVTHIQANGYEDNHLQHQPQQQNSITTDPSSSASRFTHQETPKINYDQDGKLISVRYSTKNVPLASSEDKEQNQAHIEALKHKLRYYQRKLAVKTHRYQKLKSLTKGRSNKTRLLESLKTCKADFAPCIFEIFKRQIKGPMSKHGNRWPDEVKSFSSAIYLRSKCAYKFIRKSIDLPSESIVKRYITEKNISKIPPDELNDEDERGLDGKSE